MKLMNFKIVMIVAALVLCATAQTFADNGGNIFQVPKSRLEQNKEDSGKRAEAAQARTAEMNKKWKAQQKKAEKAKAKAKAKAKKEAEKKKKKAEKEARKAQGK